MDNRNYHTFSEYMKKNESRLTASMEDYLSIQDSQESMSCQMHLMYIRLLPQEWYKGLENKIF